jgi:hypothetical protein
MIRLYQSFKRLKGISPEVAGFIPGVAKFHRVRKDPNAYRLICLFYVKLK